MQRGRFVFIALALLAICASAARADTVTVDKLAYDGTVNGIRNGRLSITLKAGGTEKQFDLDQVVTIDLGASPKLLDAEKARADDPKKSAALYKQAIAAINKPEVKLVAQWRAIEPTDKDGRWTEALAMFLEVYQASPTETVWKGRPSHWPEGGSKVLADGAERVAAAVKSARSEEARKNLKTYLVEIYLKAGDNAAAGQLAKEIQTGIAEDPRAAAPAPVVPTAADELLQKKDYAGALKQAGALLDAGAGGETAVRLFAVEAQCYEALEKWDDAAGAWLRIPAHYPSSAGAPAALQRAAEIQRKLNRPDAAAALVKEILTAYPESKEAGALRK